jgi:hypothetical protein
MPNRAVYSPHPCLPFSSPQTVSSLRWSLQRAYRPGWSLRPLVLSLRARGCRQVDRGRACSARILYPNRLDVQVRLIPFPSPSPPPCYLLLLHLQSRPLRVKLYFVFGTNEGSGSWSPLWSCSTRPSSALGRVPFSQRQLESVYIQGIWIIGSRYSKSCSLCCC